MRVYFYFRMGNLRLTSCFVFRDLMMFSMSYMLICGLALSMCSFNAYGYTKCSKDAQAQISTFATRTLLASVVHALV